VHSNRQRRSHRRKIENVSLSISDIYQNERTTSQSNRERISLCQRIKSQPPPGPKSKKDDDYDNDDDDDDSCTHTCNDPTIQKSDRRRDGRVFGDLVTMYVIHHQSHWPISGEALRRILSLALKPISIPSPACRLLAGIQQQTRQRKNRSGINSSSNNNISIRSSRSSVEMVPERLSLVIGRSKHGMPLGNLVQLALAIFYAEDEDSIDDAAVAVDSVAHYLLDPTTQLPLNLHW
jgi:hypothetical protein